MNIETAFDSMWSDLLASHSLVIVTLAGLIMVVWDALRPNNRLIPRFGLLALVAAFALEAIAVQNPAGTAYFELLRVGGFASFVNIVILLATALTFLLSFSYLEGIGRNRGDIYSLVMFATAGMIVLGTSNSLITIFVGLETMSICLYVLTGLMRDDESGTESALKYFLLGAFSTGFFLYGIALLYGATGTMYLHEMRAGLEGTGAMLLFWFGVAMLLVGFLFKVSAVPFHMWTPDVYQGAPTTLTGYMSTASKASAFAALILVLYSALPDARWSLVLATVAAITMVLGNVVAIAQTNLKRMLAYSSIAHAGYVLVGLAAASPDGYAGALYYLLVYSVMNIGAFGVAALLEVDGETGSSQTIDALQGAGFKKPLLGVLMGFFMFSLTGFPPLGGFIGKYAVFAPAVDAGLVWLVVLGVLASVASGFYYLRVLYVMWMKPAADDAPEFSVTSQTSTVVLTVCAVLLVVLGTYPVLLQTTTEFFTAGTTVALLP
jgi:NADH-quinone oxidoreductase subunit N